MASVPTSSHASFTEVNWSPVDESKRSEADIQLDACLDALLYQDNAFRPVTHNLLKRLEQAKATLGEANTLFIEGLRRFGRLDPPFEYLTRAEEKGCDHPYFYYFLAECHRGVCQGCPVDEAKALEYYNMAIKGGCSWMYQYNSITCKSQRKFITYLLGLESEGFIDEEVFLHIGMCKEYGDGCRQDRTMAKEYYKRAADLGFVSGYQSLSRMLWNDDGNDDNDDSMTADRCKAILPLLEAEEKGIGAKDDRILKNLIGQLWYGHFDKFNTNPLGKYQTRAEMALHYCDVLIQRGSPLGYSLKGGLYMKGSTGVPKDEVKAVSIWEKADRMGLASFQTYSELQLAYREGKGARVDGMKVLAYAEKALQVVNQSTDVLSAFQWMIEVYRKGLTPVSQDGNKVLECCNRALQIISYDGNKAKVFSWIGDVYKEGIHPVVQDGTKALEFYDKAIHLASRFDTFHISKAEVYLKGVHPIPRDGAKALKCYETALQHIGNYRNVQGCIAQLYEIGVPPIDQDLAKAQEHRHRQSYI